MALTIEQIKEIFPGARADISGSSNARNATRFLVNAEVMLVQINNSPDNKTTQAGAPKKAMLKDISDMGVGIEFSEAIKANELFAIRLLRKDNSALWIRCTGVRWSHIDGKTFSIGAKLTGTFSKT